MIFSRVLLNIVNCILFCFFLTLFLNVIFLVGAIMLGIVKKIEEWKKTRVAEGNASSDAPAKKKKGKEKQG
jgi:hypothetical protein